MRFMILSCALLMGMACNKGNKAEMTAAQGVVDENGNRPSKVSESSDQTGISNGDSAPSCSGQTDIAVEGFGGRLLTPGSKVQPDEIPVLGDRFRIKPFEVLSQEYERVTGVVPEFLINAASAFGAAPERWYIEPEASSITLFTTYKISYEAALKMVEADSNYSQTPDALTAANHCRQFALKAWNRQATDSEVASCSNVAVDVTKDVANPQVRWAHAFASILTSSGFIAY